MLERIPVEIWLHIFHPLVRIGIAPPENGTLLQEIKLFEFRSNSSEKIRALDVERTRISLVCQHFYQVLRREAPRVAVVDIRGNMSKYSAHELLDSHRLELMRRIEFMSIPPQWLSQTWPELQVLVGSWTKDALIFLDHTPQLKVLQIAGYSRSGETGGHSILHHPVVSQLTHLSVDILVDGRHQTLNLPRLQFLCLRLRASTREASLPWTFPRLRSLVIRGSIDISTRDTLIPFFQAHGSSVTRLVDEATVLQGTRHVPTGILAHFPHLNVYGVSIVTFVTGVLPPHVTAPPTVHPLTILPLRLRVAIEWWGVTAGLEVLKRFMKYVAVEASYTPAMIMLDQRWDEVDVWALQISPDLCKLLLGFDSPQCPVVDSDMAWLRNLERFSSAGPRSCSYTI